MAEPNEKLNAFFERVKAVGFFERIFGWKAIALLSYDAYQEYKALDAQVKSLTSELDTVKSQLADSEKNLKNQQDSYGNLCNDWSAAKKEIERDNREVQDKLADLARLKEADAKNFKRILELEANIKVLTAQKDELTKAKAEAEAKCSAFEDSEKRNQEEYKKSIAELVDLKKRLDLDLSRNAGEKQNKIITNTELKKVPLLKKAFK